MYPRTFQLVTYFARVLTPLYTMAICVLSLMPGDEVPLGSVSDKYRHAAAYAVFAVLLACSFLKLRWWAVPAAFVLASLLGILMELFQPSFGRSRDVYDALANSIGAGIGCVAISLVLSMARTLVSERDRLSGHA